MEDEASDADVRFSLRPNRDLLNPQFERYQLSNERYPMKKLALPTPVRHISPTNDQWALQQVKIFHRAERLVPDLHYSTDDDARFYVVLDNRSVVHVRFDAKSLSWSAPVAVATLQFPSSTRSADPYPESLLFPDKEHAFFANGAGFLSVYSTGDRANPAEWQLLSSFILEKDGLTRLENFDDLPTVCPFVLADVRFTDAERRWDLLANCVYEKEELDSQKERAKTTFATRLYWATLQKEASNGEFAITRQREVIQDGHMELATLDKRAEHLVTIGGRRPVFVSDSLHPVEEQLPDGKPDAQMEVEDTTPMVDTHGNMKPLYVWTQDAEELSASFRLEEDVTRSDINFSVLADTLTLKVKGKVLLSGKLEGMVHVDTSTWTLDKNVLDITLFKLRGHFWRELVVGDKRGHYEADPKVMQQIAETLEKFSTNDDNALPSGGGPSFNSEQLEEVDTDEYEFTYVSWINGVSHAIEHLADISGHQLIFSGRLSAGGPIAFATRHDVDGVVWSLDSESELVKHMHTLNAFGYVQASHSQKQYAGCSLDGEYATLVDRKNHAFVYWQRAPLEKECQLTNRRTGAVATSVAKQLVISVAALDPDYDDADALNEFIGFHAAPGVLYLLTHKAILANAIKVTAQQ